MDTWDILKTYSIEKESGHFSFESTVGQRIDEDKACACGETRAVLPHMNKWGAQGCSVYPPGLRCQKIKRAKASKKTFIFDGRGNSTQVKNHSDVNFVITSHSSCKSPIQFILNF